MTDWTQFYGDVFGGTNKIGTINGADLFAPAGSATGSGANVSISNVVGGSVVTPSGQAVQSSGNASTDFLNRIFGTSPLSGDFYKDPSTGASVSPSATGGVNSALPDLENWVTRGATIILGFIFVAVGLVMFGRAPVVAAVKSVAG